MRLARFVIASAAKQSMGAPVDCFAALAMTIRHYVISLQRRATQLRDLSKDFVNHVRAIVRGDEPQHRRREMDGLSPVEMSVAGMGALGHPLPAALFSARGKLPITLTDFSESGATAKGAKQPPCDSYALLVRNGVKVPAVVRWIDGHRFGLDFEEPLSDARRQAAFRGARSSTPISEIM
jgi:hypothetical protein